jgi:hypothetical protein
MADLMESPVARSRQPEPEEQDYSLADLAEMDRLLHGFARLEAGRGKNSLDVGPASPDGSSQRCAGFGRAQGSG